MVEKQTKVIIGIVVAIVFLAFIGQRFDITGTGFRVTGISAKVPITSNDPALNNKFMLVNMIFSGGNDVITARFDGDDVSAETNGQYSSDPFTITARAIDQTAVYPIRVYSSDPTIYDYTLIEMINPIGFSGPQQCPPSTLVDIYSSFSGGNRFCVVRHTVGRIGTLDAPNINDQITITINADGQTQSATLSNTQADATLPGGKGFVHLDGYLATGQSAPESGNFKPVFYQTRGTWSIVRDSTATAYLNQIQPVEDRLNRAQGAFNAGSNLGSTCPSTPQNWISFSTTQRNNFKRNCMNELLAPIRTSFNNLVDRNEPISQTQSITNAGILTDNRASVNIPLDRRVGNAVVNMELQASWIGITRNVGRPEVISGQCTNLASGQQQFIETVVKNAGTSEGTFCVRTEGCPSFTQITPCTAHAVTLAPNQQATIRVEMNTNTANTIPDETCRIIAYDRNNPSVTDQGTATCSQTAVQLCTPGTQQLLNNCVQQCKTDGSGFEEAFCCSNGVPEIISLSNPIQYQCPAGSTKTSPPSSSACQKKLGIIPSFELGCKLLPKIMFIVGIIVGFIAMIFSFMGLRKFMSSMGLAFLFSLLIGLGVVAVFWVIF